MTNPWTPGPWRIVPLEEHPGDWEVWGADGMCVAGAVAFTGHTDNNARLIAAAPEMAEALAALLSDVVPVAAECPRKNINRVDYTDAEWDRVIELTTKARALLARIRGDAP